MTNMMKFWKALKKEYEECIVFFRLGDFYEMFFEDAEKASKILDLTLTGRDCGEAKRAPMCGVPYHAAEGYIAKLIEHGCKVAICEQLSDPKKGPVDRGVVRVVTRGTFIESDLLDAKKNNYIACCYAFQGKYALSYADITTGEFCVLEESSREKLLCRLSNLSVTEIIANQGAFSELSESDEVKRGALPAVQNFVSAIFERDNAEKKLKVHFSVPSMASLGLEHKEECIKAAGGLLEYLSTTQKRDVKILSNLKVLTSGETLVLDEAATNNLDIFKNSSDGKKYGSLLWLLDRTQTGMGARRLYSLLLNPLCNKQKIDERLDAVGELFDATVMRMGIVESLSEVHDIERIAGKVCNGNLQPRDCVLLCRSLSVLPSLKMKLSGFSSQILKDIAASLADTKEICALLDAAFDENAGLLREGNFIKKGFNSDLDSYREKGEDARGLITELEIREREKTGIRSLKVGYNRIFGYYIEVPNTFRGKVPYSYTRKQTVANKERYVNDELKKLESDVSGSSQKASLIEQQLFLEISEILEKNVPVLKKISEAISYLDCLTSLATVAKENRYIRPDVYEDGALRIREGRHPVVEAISREQFVPNDCIMDGGVNRTLIITGPNMAGKSTYLRQNALIVFMAHVGSFVPAKEADIPLFDRIFTRIGASDNLILDRSTFMVEMTEVANILRNATEKSLLVLDEVGRGTSTYDGLSIAWAVIEYLNGHFRAKTLFATHYHELTQLEGKLSGIKNYKISVREEDGKIIFLRKIVRGGASRSFGVEVAAMAGVPVEVIANAKEILKKLEKNEIVQNLNKQEAEEEKKERQEEMEEGLLSELKALNPDLLSPMQALSKLSEWKEKYK